MNPQPPKWMDKILSWYCRGDKLEDLQGDLYEYFYRNLDHKGYKYASWVYFLDVLKFFRIYTVKQLKIFNRMNQFSLWKNYVKTSVRSLSRNRLFSAINIIGLAISMSVGVLLIIFITDLLSYDTFHEDADSIYRLNSNYDSSDGWGGDFASTSLIVGEKLKEQFPGVEQVVTIRRHADGAVKKGDNLLQVKGHYASEDFFKLFSFDLLHGSKTNALNDASSIAISEKTALKLFNKTDVVGEILQFEGESLKVSAVFENVPINSHLQFDLIRPLESYLVKARNDENQSFMNWDNIWMNHVYFKLKENSDLANLQAYLDQTAEVENENYEYHSVTLSVQSLNEIVPGKNLSNRIEKSVQWEFIYVLMGLVVIVILAACFNYTNLSIARSLRRAKEVGVRKVVGASSANVLSQFLAEAMIISFISGIISLVLFFLIRSPFYEILDTEGEALSSLQLDWVNGLYLFAFCLVVGVISGFLPALFLSKLKAKTILKDVSSLRLMKGVNLRKILIVIQFALSIGFIMSTVIGYRQYKHLTNVELGFKTDNIFNIRIGEADPAILQSEIDKLSFVSESSLSSMVVSYGNMMTNTIKYKDPNDSVNVNGNKVDDHYLPLHGFEFVAGENFRPFNDEAEMKYVIVNEKFLETFQMGSPNDAIGETILSESEKYRIVGVVSDFQTVTVAGAKRPFIFYSGYENFSTLNVKLNTDDVVQAIGDLNKAWNKVDPLHPMEGDFFHDQVASTYKENLSLLKLIGFLAFIVITIAAMGLLGMAVYTAETRLKEISIRKVLGASEKNLIMNLSRGFIWMLFISALIAAPLTYYLFDQHVLASSANRISINLFDIMTGVVLVFLIGAIAIGWQTLKAANTNPATTLRDE